MYVSVSVTPNAKRESVKLVKKRLVISVTQPAERNVANARVREIVAAHFSVSVSHVRLVSGHHSRSKVYSVDVE